MFVNYSCDVFVTRVIDGDSLLALDLRSPDIEYEIRLFGIDAPEYGQPFSVEATDYLQSLVSEKTLRLHVVDVDRFGRYVGILYEDRLRQSINRAMVEAGLAFSYAYSGALYGAKASEGRARKAALGVWKQQDGGIRPWDYRRGKRPEPRSEEAEEGCLGSAVAVVLFPISALLLLTACL